MDYHRVYEEFIANRRLREHLLTSGYEWHHIRPRYFGVDDSPENLVKLTYADHLFAHLLLGRIYGGVLAQSYVRSTGMKKHKTGRQVRINFELMKKLAVQKASQTTKAQWANPDSKINSVESRSTMGFAHPGYWTQQRRESHGKKQSEVQNQQEILDNNIAKNKAKFEDPAYVASHRERIRKGWAIKEDRSKSPNTIVKMTASWTPERRASSGAKVAARHARNRELKNSSSEDSAGPGAL